MEHFNGGSSKVEKNLNMMSLIQLSLIEEGKFEF